MGEDNESRHHGPCGKSSGALLRQAIVEFCSSALVALSLGFYQSSENAGALDRVSTGADRPSCACPGTELASPMAVLGNLKPGRVLLGGTVCMGAIKSHDASIKFPSGFVLLSSVAAREFFSSRVD